MTSMAAAEYNSGAVTDTHVAITAYAAEQPVSAALVAASDDFSIFVPDLRSVPEPAIRPSVQ